MRRTKGTALVKKVLGPHFKDELREDIKETPFSLLVDESTDVSCSKHLGVSTVYYSRMMKRIVSTFLGLVEVRTGDAIGLEGEVR